MKLLIFLAFLLPVPAIAADFTCTVPPVAVPGVNAICNKLRLEKELTPPEFSTEDCINEILRAGLLGVHSQQLGNDAADARKSALQGFARDFPARVPNPGP